MSKQGKDLKIYTNMIVTDIFDNFEKYNSSEKQSIYKLLVGMKALNETLEGYDNTKKSWYQKWIDAVENTIE